MGSWGMGNRGILLSSLFLVVFLLIALDCSHPTAPRPPSGRDTTSHAISWFDDTLGTLGYIRDVWVFSRTNALAVGEIHTPQTDRYDSSGNWIAPYNIARWDGSRWDLETTADSNHSFSQLDAVWAFGVSDVWVATDVPEHWDGRTWTYFTSSTGYNGRFWIQKIWGTSSQNMFFVGDSGNIEHYDGRSWTSMASGTKVNLQDIWGLDGTHIWATGTNTGDGHCVVLQFNGQGWSIFYDNSNEPTQTSFGFSSVWSFDPSILYLTGGSQLRLENQGTYTQIETGGHYLSYRVRGNTSNDIFVTGQASEVSHYNGMTWYLYPEIKSINTGFAWFYSVQASANFVLVGGLSLTSVNSIPLVLRGYR